MDMTDDVCFVYNGRDCCINPHNDECIDVGYNKVVRRCKNINEVFALPLFDGKPIKEICDKITLTK